MLSGSQSLARQSGAALAIALGLLLPGVGLDGPAPAIAQSARSEDAEIALRQGVRLIQQGQSG